jgi:hypothetical protein
MRIDDECRSRDKEGIAVGCGARRDLGSDHCARSGSVFDYDCYALSAADLVTEEAGDNIGGATWRVRIDDFDRSRLRRCTLAEHCNGKAQNRGSSYKHQTG